MKINIFEERFLEVDDILAVKSFLKRIDNYEVVDAALKLKIKIDLTYLDHNMMENFKTLEQECEVVLQDEMIIKDVKLIDLDLYAIDNKGVNIKYNIDIDYEVTDANDIPDSSENELEDASIIIEDDSIVNDNMTKIDNFDDINEEESYSQNESEAIQNQYQELLGNIIKTREDNKEIIEVVKNDEDTFMELFNSFSQRYIKITKLFVQDKNEVMKKYNLNDEKFEQFYDKETNLLTLRSYDWFW